MPGWHWPGRAESRFPPQRLNAFDYAPGSYEWETVGTRESSPRNLVDVLADLDIVIDRAREAGSELGLFPAMYRSVTAEIHEAVEADFFDDSARMECLAVAFADKYLDALRCWRSGNQPPAAWDAAFAAAGDGRRRTIAQHLFAGMNAHINLDLGIAVAEIPDVSLDRIHPDFEQVNAILFSRLDGLQNALGLVSRRMAFVDRIGASLDERLMRMVIGNARDHAWDLAVDLVAHPGAVDRIIAARDRETAELAVTILGGNIGVRMLSRVVARGEPNDVSEALDAFVS